MHLNGAQCEITARQADDDRFIVPSWLRAYREEHKQLEARTYYDWQEGRIRGVMARGPLVLVARDPASPIYVYGYGVFERIGAAFVAHWVYVKKGPAGHWRQNGLGKALLAAALEQIGSGAEQLVATHRTWVEDDHRLATKYGFAYVPLERLYRSKEAA